MAADTLGVDDDAAADPIGVDRVGPLRDTLARGRHEDDGGRNDLEEGLLGAEPGAPLQVGVAPQTGNALGWVVMVGGPHPIAQLERVQWLGRQLQGYGFSRAAARHGSSSPTSGS